MGAVLVTMLRLINLGGSIAPGAFRLRVVVIIVQVQAEDDDIGLRDIFMDGLVRYLMVV